VDDQTHVFGDQEFDQEELEELGEQEQADDRRARRCPRLRAKPRSEWEIESATGNIILRHDGTKTQVTHFNYICFFLNISYHVFLSHYLNHFIGGCLNKLWSAHLLRLSRRIWLVHGLLGRRSHGTIVIVGLMHGRGKSLSQRLMTDP
jgi:hypothetical protein